MTATAPAPAQAEPSFPEIPLDQITESKTNPRKHFDKAALDELAASVREHGVLSPILVRPLAPGRYELVAGARRFRAAKAAGLEAIPAAVRELDNKQALEVQVVENLQRSDLSPLEEARGYELLHKRHGYSVDELAAKVGKSKAYVYARMKLCALPKGAQKLLDEGLLDASRALLVARIPVPELAEKAAREIAFGRWAATKSKPAQQDIQPMAYREAAEHVQEEYMLLLKEAPFPTGDADLVPAAGACGSCPKRTGNQKGLFNDVSSADVCTDPKCFQTKVGAWFDRRAADVEAKGGQVIDGKKADGLAYDSGLVDLDRGCSSDPKYRHFRALLGKAVEDLKPVLCRDSRGEVFERFSAKEVAAALKAKGHKFAQGSRSSLRTGGPDLKARKAERAHRVRQKAARLARPELVKLGEKVNDMALMRFLAVRFAATAFETRAALERHGIPHRFGDLQKAGIAALGKLGVPQLRSLLVDMGAGDRPSSTYKNEYLPAWRDACELVGLDMKTFEAQVPKAGTKAKGKKAARAVEASEDDEQLDDDAGGERACRECGCTEDAACEGGCSWVEADLCSACAPTPATAKKRSKKT